MDCVHDTSLCGAAHVIALMRHPRHVCIDEWPAYTLCPLSLPRKKPVAVMLKTKLKRTMFREFSDYLYIIVIFLNATLIARLLEEERRR